MVSVKPFAAYRPVADKVSEIASPPYDVVNEAEARAFVQQFPNSFMKVIRPEVNLEAGSSSADQHKEASKQFRSLVDQGLLIKEQSPRLYLYRQSSGEHVQTGLVACCSVDDYENDRVKKHEHVRPAKVIDRTQHFLEIGAQTGPIFLTYHGNDECRALTKKELAKPALYDFTAEDGVRHEVFLVDDIEAFEKAFQKVDALYIADGHHRTASACAVRKSRREAGEIADDDASHGFLAVVFPEDELKILAYNRLVKDLNGHSAEDLVAAVAKVAPLHSDSSVPPKEKGLVGFYVGGEWRVMDLRSLAKEAGLDPEQALDAHILQSKILNPLLGIDDPRTNPRIYFWGGHRGPDKLAKEVDEGHAAISFSLYPVAMTDIMDVSDADRVMPPKSTWFVPKLRSGLFVYDLS